VSREDTHGEGDEAGTDAADGRYLYCLVGLGGHDPALETTGIEGAPVRVVGVDLGAGAVGAVVHDADGLYDSTDPAEVRRWLVAHQSVVDAAADRFGTPLPVRFDTVVEGGDDALAGWVRGHGEEILAALDRVAGRREYRLHVAWDRAAFEDRVEGTDDRLVELRAEASEASEGRAFLVGKQAEERLRELAAERRRELLAALRERVEGVVVEMEDADPRDDDGEADVEGTPIGGVTVLCDRDRETELGDRLDAYVDAHEVSVTFSGPWPPYSFVPGVDS
jgi:hypothetical protein